MTDPIMTLEAALSELAEIRRKVEQAQSQITDTTAKLHDTDEWHELVNDRAAYDLLSQAGDDATNGIRELALDIAVELEQSKPIDGIHVVKKKSSIIVDDAEALEYVKDRHPEILEFNDKALRKILEAMPEHARPAFFMIEVEEFGTVRISSDLNESYPADGVPF